MILKLYVNIYLGLINFSPHCSTRVTNHSRRGCVHGHMTSLNFGK